MCFTSKESVSSAHHKVMGLARGDALSHVLSIYWHSFLEVRDFKARSGLYGWRKGDSGTSNVQPGASSSVLSKTHVSFWPGSPEQGLETRAHGPNQPLPIFVNQVLLAHSHTRSLCVCGCSCVPTGEMVQPAEPKYLQTTWQEAFAAPCSATLWTRGYRMLAIVGKLEDVEVENAVPALKEFLAL